MCSTCDFEFPGDVHICPACAAAPPKATLSSRRQGLVVGAYIAAVVTTIVLGLVFSGVLMSDLDGHGQAQEAADTILGVFMLGPSIAGVALSLCAYDRRLPNPASVWGAIIWNGGMMALLVLLSVVGAFM
jgi:hypothetical protein